MLSSVSMFFTFSVSTLFLCLAQVTNCMKNNRSINLILVAQDQVPESDRCVVGGVQNSLQSAMDMLGYIMGMIISNPQVNSSLDHVFVQHFNMTQRFL
jgi:iron-regulated transporter 1